MKKRILSVFVLAGMTATLHPAKVIIENRTKEKVWARINDQKRPQRTEIGQHMAGIKEGAAAVFTGGISELAVAPTRAVRSRFGYPNFWSIAPGKQKELGTAIFLKNIREAGISPEAIRKVTFLRIKGEKTITGTAEELKKQVEQFAKQYGNTEIGFEYGDLFLYKDVIYTPFDGPQKSWLYRKGEKYNIQIPIIESFVYDFGTNPIRTKRTLRLTSWGNAVQGIYDKDKGYTREFKEIPQAAPRQVKQTALRRWIQEYKELRAKRRAGTASTQELKKIDEQMRKIKKAAAAAGMATAFITGIALGKATQDTKTIPVMRIPVKAKEVPAHKMEEPVFPKNQ